MTKQRIIFLITAVAAGTLAIALGLRRPNLVLTGLVTTDETIASSEIQGRLQQLIASPGDAVKRGHNAGDGMVRRAPTC